MSHLTDAINKAAAMRPRKPRPLKKPGDIVWLFRQASITSATVPDANKLISRCYVVTDRSGGMYVHVLADGENVPRDPEAPPAFCARTLYEVFGDEAEALEHVAALVENHRQALESVAARWADVHAALTSRLERELLRA